MRQLFSNRPAGKDFSINFFHWNARGVKSAQLACPFFTNTEPLKILRDAGCSKIQLLVRLCEVTNPDALAEVQSLEGVNVRFFTAPSFHAKFYILGNVALVGSANLTGGGMMSNRELSVTVSSGEEAFDYIPMQFDELWNSASVFTVDALKKFRAWRENHNPQHSPPIDGIEPSKPANINVSTQKPDKTRSYLESFRALYVENLIPAYNLVKRIYDEAGQRHPVFEGYSQSYEYDRFLFWVRGFTTDEQLGQQPIREGAELQNFIRARVSDWLALDEEEMYIDLERIERIDKLQFTFADKTRLQKIEMDEIADLLQASAAFVEMLRFTKGGLPKHIEAFKKGNSINMIRSSLYHLAYGQGDYVQRVYDCIYSPEFKLSHWGRNCTLELFGWINQDGAPPFNGRIMKALRYLGFDVAV